MLLRNILYPTYLKRFLFFLISDIILISCSLFLSLVFHFDFNININYLSLVWEVLAFFVSVKLIAFGIFRIYRMTWRYVGINDLFNIIFALFFSGLVLVAMSIPYANIPHLPVTGFPKRILFADGIISLCLISGLRISKRLYLEVLREKGPSKRGKRTIILGAGNTGEMILRNMARHGYSEFNPIGFLDDDRAKIGTYIHGIKVLNTTHTLSDIIAENAIEAVIIAIPTLNYKKLRETYDSARKLNVNHIKIVPRIYNYEKPEINLKTLEDIIADEIRRKGDQKNISFFAFTATPKPEP